MIEESQYRGVNTDSGLDRGLAWRMRQPVVPLAKRGARWLGQLTASQRCLPDYLIVGAKRSGSTTLARNLVACEDVLPLFPQREDRKGTYFFDVHYARGERWYRSHFPLQRTRQRAATKLSRMVVTGEASPYYLHHPHAPDRAARLVPEARVICIVRDPVERAYSHWRERTRQGIETMSFDAAVDAEDTRLHGEWQRMLDDPGYVSLAHLNHGYVAQSRYTESIERWEAAFGRERLLVVRSETLFASPDAVIAATRSFLGLVEQPLASPKHFNQLPGSALAPSLVDQLRERFATDQYYLTRWLDHSG